MKALVLEEPGDPPVLAVKEVPTPVLGPGDVLVRVSACGFCHHDLLVIRGVLRRGVKPQVVLGHEISGQVAECGLQVTLFAPGDRVTSILTDACGTCPQCQRGREHRCLEGVGIGHGADGGFAEYVKIGQHSLLKLPPEADPIGSCLYGCPMGVALHALRDAAGLQTGETLVVTGAGGGLGLHAAQVGRTLGARVFAVTTSAEKEAGLEEFGLHQVLCAPDLDFGEIVQAMTDDQGADVVMNNLGAPGFDACWTALAQFGRMAVVGDLEGGSISIRPAELLFKDASLTGVSGVSRRQVEDVAAMVAAGLVRPVISRTFPLEEALQAYRLMRERKSFGRLALVPG